MSAGTSVMVTTQARNLPRPNSDSSCWPNNQKNTTPSSGQICRLGGDGPREQPPELEVAHQGGYERRACWK